MPQIESGKNNCAAILREISRSESRRAQIEDQTASLIRLAANPVLLNSHLRRSPGGAPPDTLYSSPRASLFSHSEALSKPHAARSRTDYVPLQPPGDVHASPEAFYPSDSDKSLAFDADRSQQVAPRPEFDRARLGLWSFLGGAFFYLLCLVVRR